MHVSPLHLKIAAHHIDWEPVLLGATFVVSQSAFSHFSTQLEAFDKILVSGGHVLTVVIGLAVLFRILFGGTTTNKEQLGEATKFAPTLVKIALSALAAFGVFAMFRSARASAVPAEPLGLVSQRRKLSDDHAGDDGEVLVSDDADAPAMLLAARGFLGWHERLPNGRPNPLVQEMFLYVGMSANTDCRKVAWCSAGLNKVCSVLNIKGTGNAMARSWLRWGEACEAKVGAVVVFWRGDHNDGETGHVGVIDSISEDGTLNVLGFNQRDCVCVAKFGTSRVLGYRQPARPLTKTKTVRGAALGLVGTTGNATVASIPADPSPAPAVAADVIEQSRGVLEVLSANVAGNWRMYLHIALTLLTVAGLILSIYGRKDIREKTGF